MRISLNSLVLPVVRNFMVGSRIGPYISHLKYQVKSHLSPRFSAACAAAIAHRNHFLRSYQQIKSSAFKVKFRQDSSRCMRVLEAAKLAYGNKTKEFITRDF